MADLCIPGRGVPLLVIGQLLLAVASFGQNGPDSLALASGTAAPNGLASVSLFLASPSHSEPVGLQWTISYPINVLSLSVVPGPALAAANKTLTCQAGVGATYTCVAWSLDSGIISNGAVATVNLVLPVGAGITPLTVINSVAASGSGTAIPVLASGGTVIGGAWPSISSLACAPNALNTPGVSTCTVSLTGAAPSGGASVALSSTNSALNVPATITTPAGAASVAFTANAPNLVNNQNSTITATYNNTSANANIQLAATQYPLTTAVSPGAGGSISPVSGTYYNAGSAVNVTATPAPGYQFIGWSGPVAAPGNPATTVTMSGPEAITANFIALTPVTVQTNPAGLQFSLDGGALQTAPQTMNLLPGSHAIAVAAAQAGAPGVQYVFNQWSDGLGPAHNITIGSASATYIASFGVQYLLTTTTSPAGAGALQISPAAAGYYAAGTNVQLTALPNLGYQFNGWAGSLTGATNPQSIILNGPANVTANFGTASCTIGINPPAASLPATGTSTMTTCPNHSGQPECGVSPELPMAFTVTPSASCGVWTVASSNPSVLQVTASGSGVATVQYTLLNNTHTSQQSYTVTVASATGSASYSATEAGSGDSQVYREVYALYEQLLGRDPDSGGFTFWTGTGAASLGQMADAFLTSAESFNSNFAVMAVYQAATGAPPTYAQFIAAVAGVRAGTQSITGLINSLIGANYTAATLYQNLLNRQPTAQEAAGAGGAGLGAWLQTLIGYPAAATPIGAPNNEFQSTGTFHTTQAADHTNALYLQMLYYVLLGRNPDAGGFSYWLGVANTGGPGLLFQAAAGYATRIQISGPGTPNQGFVGSPEFQGLFVN